MDSLTYKHYILLDENFYVIDGWSSGIHPEKETAFAICINENGSYQFKLNGIVNPVLRDKNRNPIFKFVDGQIIKHNDEFEKKRDGIDANNFQVMRSTVHYLNRFWKRRAMALVGGPPIDYDYPDDGMNDNGYLPEEVTDAILGENEINHEFMEYPPSYGGEVS